MKVKTMGAAMLAGAMIVGCGVKDDADSAADAVAVSVNGAKLMQSAIDADVAKMVEVQGSRIPAEQMEYAKKMMANQVAQSFIVENVLVAKAKAEGFAVTDADRKERENEFLKAVAKMPDAPKTIDEYFKKFPLGEDRARKEFELGIIIDKMIKSYRAKQQPSKDYSAEAQKIIDNIVSNNAKAVVAEADALKRINDLKADLGKVAAGDVAKTFAEMAKKHSSCPSAQKGGDLGEFTHGQMVPEFDKVAFSLPVGKVSDPVKTQFGYHLILVTKKVPAVAAKDDKPAEPEKVAASHILIKSQSKQDVPKKDDVVKYLSKQDERSFVQDFVSAEIKKAKIEAADEYKHLIPQADEKPVASAATAEKTAAKTAPVETPAKK